MPEEQASCHSNPGQRPSTTVFADVLSGDTEPADPDHVDHEQRRQTRIAPSYRDTETIPAPYLECGCGECPARYDPLADEMDPDSHAFGDILDRSTLGDECPESRPVTVERAAEIYYRYQLAAYHREDWTSRLERVSDDYGRYMAGERRLLDDIDSPSTALLSLRLSPLEGGSGSVRDNYEIKPTNSTRQQTTTETGWIEPTRLDDRINDSWATVRRQLSRHLSEFGEWQYVTVTATTTSAATPHQHILLYVSDPDDALTVDHLRPAIESYVSNTTGATSKDHGVTAGESDAAVVQHDPDRVGYNASQVRHIQSEMDVETFKANTEGMAYLLTQRPAWTLRRLIDGQTTREEEQIALEGAAIERVSANDWIGSSRGFPTN